MVRRDRQNNIQCRAITGFDPSLYRTDPAAAIVETMSDDKPVFTQGHSDKAIAPDAIWSLLLALAERRRKGIQPTLPVGLTLSRDGELLMVTPGDPAARLIWDSQGLSATSAQEPATQDLVSLYAPFFPGDTKRSLVLAHLGQSIDAKIATSSGDSCHVTGQENIVHLHRLRALCDAVIIGAGTAAADNPRLTTRLVDGRNPVRVVIDPDRRVSGDLGLFTDGEAPSLIACADDRLTDGDTDPTVIGLARDEAGLDLPDLIARLRERGLFNLFIEGGGVTVSRWMTADLLDRLHIAIAPVFIGQGRPALDLPPAVRMASCLRPPSHVFRLGQDLLWDFDLRREKRRQPHPDDRLQEPSRVF